MHSTPKPEHMAANKMAKHLIFILHTLNIINM